MPPRVTYFWGHFISNLVNYPINCAYKSSFSLRYLYSKPWVVIFDFRALSCLGITIHKSILMEKHKEIRDVKRKQKD
jgi:hypothetical protein